MNDERRIGGPKGERISAKDDIQIERDQKDVHSNCRLKPKLSMPVASETKN